MATLLSPLPKSATSPHGRIFAPFHYWHLASLDAPTVAVTWAWAFAWATHVRVPAWAAIALALIVWTIYIGDRLLDARAGLRVPPEHDLRERHYFHWRHRRVFLVVAGLAGTTAAVLVFSQLPARSVQPDSLVAAATLLWLTGVHAHRSPAATRDSKTGREWLTAIVVGALFAAGCALPVSSQLGAGHSLAQFLKLPLVPIVVYAALAWLNLHAIDIWESERVGRVRGTAVLIALAALGAAVFCAPYFDLRSAALLAAAGCSALLLAVLDCVRGRISALNLRAVADLVLLTPVVFLFR